jgi:putative transposase
MTSRFAGSLKNVTSRLIRKEFSEHMRQFYGKPVLLWTRAYGLLTAGGVLLDVLKHYIQTQEKTNT